MTSPFDLGYKALQAIRQSNTSEKSYLRNEATTRLHLIDSLLFDCLGWEKTDCIVEESMNGTFADYTLRAPGVNLVIEAKREGTSFELPAGTTQRTQAIDYFKRHEPQIYHAIEQAIGYCTMRGVQFGAVSNGQQMIAFLGSRTDGIPPTDGNALVFPNLMGMNQEDFLALWQTLSRPGLMDRNLLSRLRSGEPAPPPEKPSSRLANYPGYQRRNDLQVNLQILADVLIQDYGRQPVQERDFLEKCYAESGALSQYALVSRKILETRYAQLTQSDFSGPAMVPATSRSGVNPYLFGDAAASRPILLIGDVGVGKTTFIRNWINVVARDLAEKSIILYMDLGVKPTLSMELDQFVADEITRQLRDGHSVDIEEDSFLRAVYHSDLQNFERGRWGSIREHDETTFLLKRAEFLDSKVDDTHDHLRKCLEHIVRGRRQQIIVFFDNLDQRDADFQQRAFLLGQSVAELWPAMVFLTLRPETYYRSRASGTLSAYHQRAFTISPPRIDRVVEKRLQYVIKMLESRAILSSEVLINTPSLHAFLEVLVQSFQYNRDLIEFIDNVCGGNVRLALEFIKVFIGSGHVDTHKIISIFEEEGQYFVPLHEFIRAVMYGDHYWYDPSATEIKNVFDISERDGREHFTVLNALAFVDRYGERADSDGYATGAQVSEHLGSMGFRMSQIVHALERARSWKLVESGARDFAPSNDDLLESKFRLTTIGSYYFRKLVGSFVYLDAVVIDTPIVEQEFRSSVLRAGSIEHRLQRAEHFCSYLDRQWSELGETEAVFDWSLMSSNAKYEIDRIRRRISR